MEIKEINYHDRLSKTMNSRFNYFVKDFLKEYSDQLDKFILLNLCFAKREKAVFSL